jgi:hypothetical protein
MATNNPQEKEFHAVDFMRQVRDELTEKFFKDRQNYLEYLKKAMEDFKIRQKKIYN